MRFEPVTTLKHKAADLIAEVAQADDPILITHDGHAAAYLVNAATYEGLKERLAILEGIVRGEQAVEQGDVATHLEAKKRLSRWLS